MSSSVPIQPLQGPVVAYVCTEQGASVARDLAANIGAPPPSLHGGGVSGAARVSDLPSGCRILLTEIGNLPLPVACESVAEIHRSGAQVVVFGQHNDITTYRAIVAAGAVDYFPFPVTSDEIIQSLGRHVANEPAPVFDPHLRFGVTGSNGGVGASVLAQNLACLSATQKRTRRQTALLDADLHFGSAACDLNRNPTAGLLEALSAPDRVDETFLTATMDQVQDLMFLYSAHLHPRGGMDEAEAGLTRLIPRMSEHFEATIVDAPRSVILRHPEMLHTLQRLVLVVPGGYSGVHSAVRMLDFLKEAEPDLQVVLVLADLRKDAGLSAKDLSKALGHEVRHHMPRSDQAMARAQRAGVPLVARQPRAAYGKAVQGLWADLVAKSVDTAKPAPRRGLMGWIKG